MFILSKKKKKNEWFVPKKETLALTAALLKVFDQIRCSASSSIWFVTCSK